jgi:hypothetical protein
MFYPNFEYAEKCTAQLHATTAHFIFIPLNIGAHKIFWPCVWFRQWRIVLWHGKVDPASIIYKTR